YPRLDKLGGNGPIMANALLAHGTTLTYIGALGTPAVHPVFEPLAARARVVSLTSPAHTTAVEFTDGKLMLGQMRTLDEITFDRLMAVMGEEALVTELAEADLVSLVNWTMIPNMTAIFRALTHQILPRVASLKTRFFFDLADPEKRSGDDLRTALGAISDFESFGRVTLGLNLKEAQQVHAALALGPMGVDEAALRGAAERIRETLKLDT